MDWSSYIGGVESVAKRLLYLSSLYIMIHYDYANIERIIYIIVIDNYVDVNVI